MLSPILANVFESPIGLLVLLVIALLFFGHKLPSVARSLGSSVSEFKKGVKQGEDEANMEADELEKKTEEKKKEESRK